MFEYLTQWSEGEHVGWSTTACAAIMPTTEQELFNEAVRIHYSYIIEYDESWDTQRTLSLIILAVSTVNRYEWNVV